MRGYGSLRARFRRVLLALGSVASLAAAPAGASAVTIDHGPVADGQSCDSCLLPFGAPVTEQSVISKLALGAVQPDQLRVARPDPATPGRWTAATPSRDVLRWAERPNTTGAGTIVDTAIPLPAGSVLVLLNPLVRPASESITGFAPAEIDGALLTGSPTPFEPTGAITVEPDADGDGYGDTTEDLCPGVARALCLAGDAEVTLDAPTYVPGLEPLVARWTVKNTSEGQQPFVVNFATPMQSERVDGPPGMACAPGRVSNPTELFVPISIRSPLVLKLYWWSNTRSGAENVSAVTKERSGVDYAFPARAVHCTLPVLPPDASWNGTITATGYTAAQGNVVIVEALSPAAALGGGSMADGYGRAVRSVQRADPAAPSLDYAPDAIQAAGAVGRRGRLSVRATCRTPVLGQTCAFTGELRAPIGGKVLAQIATPVAIAKDQTVVLTFALSKAGMRWLAAHPKTRSLRAALTNTMQGEVPVARSAKIQLRRSAAFNARLRELARR